MTHHADLLEAPFWKAHQDRIHAGQVHDEFPYDKEKRFRGGRDIAQSVTNLTFLQNMPKRSWKSYLGAVALAVALVIVLNPEVRALLFLADAIGLEALLLLFAAQFRNFLPVLRVVFEPVALALCKFSSLVASGALRGFQLALPIRPFTLLLCPVFIVLSYGVRCPVKGADS